MILLNEQIDPAIHRDIARRLRVKGTGYLRDGGIRVRLEEWEQKSARNLGLKKNRKLKRAGVDYRIMSTTNMIAAMAFSKLVGSTSQFIASQLYDGILHLPDDPLRQWCARAFQGWGIDHILLPYGCLEHEWGLPVALGEVYRGIVTFRFYLPADCGFESRSNGGFLVRKDALRPIRELVKALKKSKAA